MDTKNLNETPEGIVYFYYKDENGKEYSIDFGSEFKYNFDSKNNVLNVEKNVNHIPFFYNENDSKVIQNLSLIVGANGSGKTNLLFKIIEVLNTSMPLDNYILIFKVENEFYINKGFSLLDPVINDIDKWWYNPNKNDLNSSFIYLTNTFDYFSRQNILRSSHFYNLSTTELLKLNQEIKESEWFNDNNNYLYDIEQNKKLLKLLSAPDVPVFFNFNKIFLVRIYKDTVDPDDAIEEIKFFLLEDILYELSSQKNISKELREELVYIEEYFQNIDNPRDFYIKNERDDDRQEFNFNINRVFEIAEKESSENSLLKKALFLIDTLYQISGKLYNIQIKRHDYNSLEYFLLYNSFVQFISSLKTYRLEYFVDDANNILSLNASMDILINSLKDREDISEVYLLCKEDPAFKNLFTNEICVIDFLRVLSNTESVFGYIEYKIEETTKFREFLSFFNKSLFNRYNSIVIHFSNLSSGQLAFLNLFARLYDIKYSLDKKDNLTILIDEPELYLHPQWQKEVVLNYIKFCNTVFNDKKVQIIMTTNNAIPVSDVLKYNVVLLCQDQKQHFDNYRNTFGGNIFNLLNDTFFIQDGFIGEFAQMKIQELIDVLYEKDIMYLVEHMDEIEKRINLIGEDLIKNKLLEILEQRLSANLLSIKSTLNKLESRISNLENRKNNL